MERIVHKSRNFKEAEAWDIIQQTTASVEERLKADHFSSDILDFIRPLYEHVVKYAVVGGEAVIYYGHVRSAAKRHKDYEDIEFLRNVK